ncbi:FAD-dependent oxidoreductase [Actinomadura alba]|uniref:FAD-dependent oxidoreductase n=1 Tax=Actinomadura alba TaxID=406431 RepID=A0ABR7LTC0_9ACTN|nr:FAD-dependent oxidoreductase [Actinomadura alba]MBC6468077.1 FAD-dependent oxidoreductase [Actinomadura alba]
MESADVVVVGFGGSGAAAAIEAHDAGATVVILEKQPRADHWPSTALLAGGIMYADDSRQAGDYLQRCAGDVIPAEVSTTWAEEIVHIHEWLGSVAPDVYRLGPAYASAEYPHFPGAASIRSSHGEGLVDGEWKRASGEALFEALRSAVEARGIPVHYGARAARLLTEAGAVVGVELDPATGGRVLARRGVVLATGGFGFDAEMRRQYLTGGADVHIYGSATATGDGIRMAQAVGADLWHMSAISGRGVGHFELDDDTALNTIMLLDLAWLGDARPYGYVITDGGGRRFADESGQAELSHSFYYHLLQFDPDRGEFSRIPCYWFFDHKRVAAGPLTIPGYGNAKQVGYTWSSDNVEEIRRGWVVRADTWEELATEVGITDPATLVGEIKRYNAACSAGGDAFRDDETLTPLDEPPFYCVRLWPGGTNTTGGPRRNEHGQIVHVFGHSIQGLFGSGEMGQMMGDLYPGQYAYYAEVLCSGRIAGRSAASL